MDVRNTIAEALKQACTGVIPFNGEYPPLTLTNPLSNGDFTSPVALSAGKDKQTVADNIQKHLGTITGVSHIETKQGFINFYLSSEAIADRLAHVDEGWGSGTALHDEHVMIEYTSPNLFKPLHIGNLVGNVIGESLVRLYEAQGAEVKRFNYPSDIGLTVAKGVWGLLHAEGDEGDPQNIAAFGKAYVRGNEAYENDLTAKQEIEALNKKLYEYDARIKTGEVLTPEEMVVHEKRTIGLATSRRHLDAICAKLGTHFDKVIFESDAAPLGTELVKSHIADGTFELSDGATIFPEKHSNLHTRVFLNSLGLPTYEAKDLGNFALKQKTCDEWKWRWDCMIVITGVEQQEYFKVLFAAIRMVFPDTMQKQLQHIATGFLTLTTGKMSSRKGNVLTGESLIEDVKESARQYADKSRAENKELLAEQTAIAALKYQILKQSLGKNIVFDREKALSLDGDSGPYIQYANARARAILAKANEQRIEPRWNTTEQPTELSRLLWRFPDIVERATIELAPHMVANYAIEVASSFNSWYAQEQVLDGTQAAAHKLAIVRAVSITLTRALYLLGIPAPERM